MSTETPVPTGDATVNTPKLPDDRLLPPHRVRSLDLPEGELRARMGMRRRTGYRALPTDTAFDVGKTPGQVLLDREPALRKLRPLMTACREAATRHDLIWLVLSIGVGEYKALPPELLYRLAMGDDRHPESYTWEAQGELALRIPLARWSRHMTGVNYRDGNIRIAGGGGLACVEEFLMFMIPRSSRILVFEPGWPNGKVFAHAMGHTVVSHKLDPASGYRLPSLAELQRLYKPGDFAAIMVEKPGNPTGIGWYDDEEMETFAAFVRYMQCLAFVDEEYRLLYQYDKDGRRLRPRTILELGAMGIVTGKGLTKDISATSNRIGVMESADPGICKLFGAISNLRLSAPNWMRMQKHLGQALDDEGTNGVMAYLLGLSEEIHLNRTTAGSVFEEAGIGQYVPGNAAFYDGFLTPGLRKGGAMQCLLHHIVQAGNALRRRNAPASPVFVDCVPYPGFFHHKDGPVEGFRISLTQPVRDASKAGESTLAVASRRLAEMTQQYVDAGQPYYGTPGDVTARMLNGATSELYEGLIHGEEVMPREWPSAK